MSLDTDLEGMTAAIKGLITELKGLGTVMSSMPKNPLGGYGRGEGQINLGTSGRNTMANSLSSMTSTQIMSSGMRWNMGMSIAQGATQAFGGILAGGAMALPNVAATTGMAKNYFSASLMSGVNAQGLGNYMTRAMSGAMTDPLGASRVAGNLSAMGFARVGSMASSFENSVTATANLSKYMGIDNDTASMAIGGLASRSTSKSLMQNYGMFISNPVTGKKNTAGQTISQLGDMFLSTAGGAKLSKEDVLKSLQSGFLGSNLEGSGLDATQQALVSQYMVSKVSGKKFDIDKAGGLSQVAGAAGANPYSAEMQINSAQAGSMNAAIDAYIKGNNDAAAAVTAFQGAITGFLQSPAGQIIARGNAMVNTAMTDNAFQGLATAGGGLLNGALGIGGAALMARGLGIGMGGAKAGAGGVGKGSAGSVLKGALGKGLVGAGTAIVGGMAGDAIKGENAQGSWQSKLGTAVSWGATGAGLGMMFGPWGAAIGGGIGAIAGGIMGGDESRVATGRTSETNGPIKLIHPVKGRISAKYGNRGGAHSGSPHLGIDYAVSVGTPVLAAAEGTVKSTGGVAKNTYGSKGTRSYGLHVIIDHGGGYSTVYAHLSSIAVSAGQTVKQGQPVGNSGNTGYSTGPHLHFELRKNGQKIDPSSALGGNYAENGSYSAQVGSQESSSQMYSPDSGVSGTDLLGGANTGTADKVSIPSSYSGAKVGSGAATATASGSSVGIGHGASTVGAVSVGSGMGGGPEPTTTKSGPGNNVTIHLSLANASSAEAEKFAIMVKEYLEDDRLSSNMGRM